VTPADLQRFGIGWSLKLTNEGGFIVALLAGIVIANFFPRFADWLKEAIRPELYIKVAIVILGGFLAVTFASRLNLASSLLLRGIAAIVEAYLIYWAVVYFVARKWFGFSREWSAPLASGISICGVAASIATGGAIRARPQVPVLVSSLVVIFAVVEVLILPWLAQTFLAHEPLVVAAWIGLAIKTDGAAIAGGGARVAGLTRLWRAPMVRPPSSGPAMPRALDDDASDAAERRVMRKLRGMMIGSSLVMIVGFLVVFGVIAYRLSSGTEKVRAPEVSLQLPAGARVIATAASEGRLFVSIEVAGATEVRIFDLNTLEPRGRLRLSPQP
jgi:Conserved hypothetical protein 698/Family of unknown function (DUF6476)